MAMMVIIVAQKSTKETIVASDSDQEQLSETDM